MKKYLLIVTVFVLGLSIAACTGKKAENANATDDTTKQEVTATTDSVDVSDVLVKYEAAIEQAIDLQDKVLSGDTAAAQDFAKLSDDITTMATNLQNAAADLTPEQTQKLADLGQKWAAAAAKNVQQ